MPFDLNTAYFRRWLHRTAQVVNEQSSHFTDLDAAIGDADHGANLDRGFTAAAAAIAKDEPACPGALLTTVGSVLTNTVGGASGPLFGTVLRRMGKKLGEAETVTAEALGEALAAALASVQRLGDAVPGDKTLVDALAPAVAAYATALESGARTEDALRAAAVAAREGAEATAALQARRGRASYLGERSIGHPDPGATSTAIILTALYEATDRDVCSTSAPQGSARAEEASLDRTAPDRVGIVLVSHSREVAAATAELAKALTGMDDPAPIAAAGGTEDGRIGTSAELVRQALKEVDGGKGVAVVCDMGSAVLTLKALLAEGGLADGVRIADTPSWKAPSRPSSRPPSVETSTW